MSLERRLDMRTFIWRSFDVVVRHPGVVRDNDTCVTSLWCALTVANERPGMRTSHNATVPSSSPAANSAGRVGSHDALSTPLENDHQNGSCTVRESSTAHRLSELPVRRPATSDGFHATAWTLSL
jgi:hypothetical protein